MFIDLPLGHTTGLPNDVVGQRALLTDGLAAAHAMTEPGSIIDLPYRYIDDGWKSNPLSWSRRRQSSGMSAEPTGDTRTSRSAEPMYQSDDDRAAAQAVDRDEQCLVCLGLEPLPSS